MTGQNTCRGFSWGCERRLRRTAASYQQRWCWVRLWYCPASRRPRVSRRRRRGGRTGTCWCRPLLATSLRDHCPQQRQERRCRPPSSSARRSTSGRAARYRRWALYAGPYKVVERRPKTFTVLVGEKVDGVCGPAEAPHRAGAVPAGGAAAPRSDAEAGCLFQQRRRGCRR